MEREEGLRRRRELYRLKRSTETPEQREARLTAQRERERRQCAALTSEDRQALTQQRRERYNNTRSTCRSPITAHVSIIVC